MRMKVKTITSYAGYSRYLAECGETLGFIPRDLEIETPYTSGAVHAVFAGPDGKSVIVCEVGHRRYQIFAVEPWEITSEAKAEEAYMQRIRKEDGKNGE
jgi:hypothetical protein